MVFTAALFCQLLLVASTFALPSLSDRLAARLERRARSGYQSRPEFTSDSIVKSNTTHVIYGENWAGAVLVADTATYEVVTGIITVPTPKVPPGGDSSTLYTASAWVGIDGYTCRTAILQTGIDFTVRGNKVSYVAWYQWLPDAAYDFEDININAGDQILLVVTAPSATTGTALISNLSTGKSVSHSFTSSDYPLCRTNAEWIVEDPQNDTNKFLPFADFGTVTFSSAQALSATSGSVGPSKAENTLDINQNNQILTGTYVTGNNVIVEYAVDSGSRGTAYRRDGVSKS